MPPLIPTIPPFLEFHDIRMFEGGQYRLYLLADPHSADGQRESYFECITSIK
jgi:hypothetical protein